MNKHMDGKSFDNVTARIAELKRLFPEAVKEGRFDPELLVGLLEENDETYGLNDERYDFLWKGKAEALRLAQRRSDGTLRPCFEESRDWDATQNLYIEGDNLEVMKLLQQGYLRSVKMIYIDPPYNTGNDFVYQDDFADPIAKYKEETKGDTRRSSWRDPEAIKIACGKGHFQALGGVDYTVADNWSNAKMAVT